VAGLIGQIYWPAFAPSATNGPTCVTSATWSRSPVLMFLFALIGRVGQVNTG
jgi:hypothetical protein